MTGGRGCGRLAEGPMWIVRLAVPSRTKNNPILLGFGAKVETGFPACEVVPHVVAGPLLRLRGGAEGELFGEKNVDAVGHIGGLGKSQPDGAADVLDRTQVLIDEGVEHGSPDADLP